MLGPRMRTAPKDGRLAIVTGSPEERHALGVQMVADFLEGDGWEVLNLGASTPARDLARLADAERPTSSRSRPPPPPACRAPPRRWRSCARSPAPARRARRPAVERPRPRDAAESLGADLVLDGPRELVATLRERFPPLRPDARGALRLASYRCVSRAASSCWSPPSCCARRRRRAPRPRGRGAPRRPAGRADPAAASQRPRGDAAARPVRLRPRAPRGVRAPRRRRHAHVLYARSPGGAGATAQRVARWRPQIEAAAKAADVDPDRLEALVFLESAGREDAMAGRHRGRGRA